MELVVTPLGSDTEERTSIDDRHVSELMLSEWNLRNERMEKKIQIPLSFIDKLPHTDSHIASWHKALH